MENNKAEKTIRNRQNKQKNILLEHLRRYPIIQVVCEKSGVARPTYYRWCNEDEKFRKDAEEAMTEGEELFNDLGEHQLLTLMKDKHWPSIRYWLDKRHPKFNRTKIQVDEQIEIAFDYKQKN